MKIAIYYSSVTGNTQKMAEYLQKMLQEDGEESSLYATAQTDNIEPADLYIIAYWCRRSSMDDRSMKILARCQGKKIIAAGTIGGKAEGPYGQRVIQTVKEQIEKENECLGSLICQGMIAPERTERRRTLPADDPHYLDDEGYRRHLANRGRPHDLDLQTIYADVKGILEGIELCSHR